MRRGFSSLLACLAGCAAGSGPEPEPPQAPLVLTQTSPASISQLCAEASTRSWAVLAEDETVATTRGACLGLEAEGWHLVSQLHDAGAERPAYELHLWLDEAGHPATAQMRTGVATAYYDWTPQSLTVSLHGDSHTLTFDQPRHDIWVLPSHALYLREAMLRLGTGAIDIGILQLGFVPEVGEIVPLPLVPDDQGGLTVGEGAARFVMSPQTTGLADLRVLEVLTGERAAYRQAETDAALEPSLPETPAPRYRAAEDLRVLATTVPAKGGEPALAGELVMAADAASPRPGVVFISGSGPQDRYGFVPGTSIDTGSHEIHDALARRGFAVLRYDDRGVGESERGDDATPGFWAQVDDAKRALETLSKHPDVDPKRIIVIGHGEGALAASILAGGRKTRVSAAVLLSPAARNARDLIYWLLRRSMAGELDAKIETAIARAKQLHDAVIADRELPAASEPMRDWMFEIFREDPLARLQKVRAPVLVISGEKDFQTDPVLDHEPIAEHLDRRGRKGSQSRLFPGLDHLLKPEPGTSTIGHYGDLSRHVDPNVVAFLADWCRDRVER